MSKVLFRAAENSGMDTNNPPKLDRDDPMWDVAKGIEDTVRAIRKARGVKNPEDCPPGTPEHEAILQEFLLDVLAALGDEDDEADSFGAGAAG
jgi:hypothetical protein